MNQKILLVSNKVMHYRVPVYNEFAARFRERGIELVVRASKLQRENPHPIEFNFRAMPLSFDVYAREIKNLHPDAVIVFLHLKDLMLWPLVHWLKLRHIPCLFWTKGANLDHAGSWLRRLPFRYLHSVFDGLILYSEHEISFISPRNRAKVSVAPNALHFGAPALFDRNSVKNAFGLDFEKIVLFVGRMDVGRGRKKVEHLVEVFRSIDRAGWGLVIAGAGMSEQTLRLLNPANTRYLGEIHDPDQTRMSGLFQAADVFCIPGHVGLGLNEAFHWALPVVTEEGRQPPEFHSLVNGRNGFVVPENDLDALKERLVYLLDHDSERIRMGQAARRDIGERAGIEKMFEGFLNAYLRTRTARPALAGEVR